MAVPLTWRSIRGLLSGRTALCLLLVASAALSEQSPKPAPQFTQRAAAAWINSAPLTIESFRGRVLLIDVWTFDCWNCYRSIPWLTELERRLAPRGLAVLGIHSPEFEHEQDSARYWPAFYVIDKRGAIRGRFVGETHSGDRRAGEIERQIEALLAE
jgi:thiol-disulfide isomerase/thioredoxin